jgi:hypothetical protein
MERVLERSPVAREQIDIAAAARAPILVVQPMRS